MKKQLEICKVCTNKKVSFEKGIICSLTDAKATFIDICDDFIENESVKKDIEFKRKKIVKENVSTGVILLLGSLLVYFGLPWLLAKMNLHNLIPSKNIIKTISFILAGIGIYSLIKIVKFNFNSKSIKNIEMNKTNNPNSIFPKVSFGTIIILFFLPFFLIKCGGEQVANLSGFQLVTGTEIGGSQFGNSQKIEANFFAIISFLCALAGLIIAFLKIEKAKLISLIVSVVGLICLILLYNKASNEILKSGEGMITISLGAGYYLTFLGYLINSIFFGYAIKEEQK